MSKYRLVFLLMLCMSQFANAVSVQSVQLPNSAAIANIAFEESVGLLAITQQGELWQQQVDWQLLSHDVASDSPLVAGFQKIAFTDKQRHFQLISQGRLQSSSIKISPHSGFVPLALATIAVVEQDGKAHIARIEAQPELKVVAIRQDFTVLPDLNPLSLELNHNGKHIAVLAKPTKQYAHGVLGDGWEAKQVRYLERHDLRDLAAPLILNEIDVIEDNAPIAAYYQQKNAIATTISNGQEGARAALITLENNALVVAAQSKPIGQAYRWLSLISARQQLFSVVKPHLSGTLTAYDTSKATLPQSKLAQGVSNHKIGSYQRNISLVMHNQIVLPSANFRELKMWDLTQNRFRDDKLVFNADIVKLVQFKQDFLVLLRNGELHQVSF
ncbi:hypothetical protein [Testudinibacter aquarius]|uniref:Aspartyl protease n=1 Tax=Testudinibacter aquarius TaxID=1524974 RepID=A0A4R3Y6H2_9PAST|nr:hypothetical protein [Testudinibacter aquarius]KAE9528012.1 hypothetical protein A1D24_01190 [Testudinibacter aquarius]TCV86468.1 hypothetical protein EDC16_10613 [Testudinibacter aquarius]TNG90217.1 hypothetical protein FHQ21_09390 [Testudinibacter aquarius]